MTLKHGDYVFHVSFSNDGKMVASSGGDQRVKVWSIKDGTLIEQFPDYGHTVFSFGFLSSGYAIRTLVHGGGGDLIGPPGFKGWTLKRGDLKTGKLKVEGSVGGHERPVAYWPKSATVVSMFRDPGNSAAPHALRLLNVDEKKSVTTHFSEPIGIPTYFSPDKKLVLLTGTKGKVTVAEIGSGKVVASFPVHECESMMLSPDNKTLLTLKKGDYRVLHFWDTATGKYRDGKHIAKRFYDKLADISPDGRLLAVIGNSSISLYDFKTETFVAFQPLPPGEILGFYTLCFSPDGRLYAAGTGGGKVYVFQSPRLDP